MSEIDDAMRRYPTTTKQVRAHWDGYDEIARLRAENERLLESLDASVRSFQIQFDQFAEALDRAEKAEAENERLLGLLRDVWEVLNFAGALREGDGLHTRIERALAGCSVPDPRDAEIARLRTALEEARAMLAKWRYAKDAALMVESIDAALAPVAAGSEGTASVVED